MNTAHSSTLVAEVQGYAELQREVHDALRAQHPEWIEADGKSPTCDSYELRLAELLVSHRNEFASGKLSLPITTTYKPSQIKEAIEHSQRGGKVLLDFNHPN